MVVVSTCKNGLPSNRLTVPVLIGGKWMATTKARTTRKRAIFDAVPMIVLLLTIILSVHPNGSCHALNPPAPASGRTHFRCAACLSPLFLRPTHHLGRSAPRQQPPSTIQRDSRYRYGRHIYRRSLPGTSSTALQMVLTTPESIIEQASTINLLDDLIDESVRTSARRPIMMQFDPSSGWIWRRWTGTIFSETWTSCVRNMLYALAIFLIQRTYPSINKNLAGFGTLWGQLLSVTTFTLTFFVNQSYSLWRKCMELSRRLQGRLHDVGLNMASHADRKMPTNPTEKATYTASSRQILELMSRYVRLFNLLTYASFTRSHRPILTPRGMRRLVERGLMTATEREVLVDAAIPATQRHSVVLMWMIRLFVEGRASGHILGGAGFEAETMNKFHIIRSQYGAIGDELQGRMPLAYAHIVQVLVDLILWMFPIMAFSTGMSPVLVVLGTGLLTISYQGLFDLAKQFLDPYDNESYGRGEDPLCVDTLIAETNAGSVRWMYGFEEMPFSAQRVKDGEMYDYLLPVRGYSVEELTQMEEERKERERLQEEQRKREEEEAAERLEAEEAMPERPEGEEGVLDDEVKGGNNDQELLVETSNSSSTIKSMPTSETNEDVKGNEILVGGEDSSQASFASMPAMASNPTSESVLSAGAQNTEESRQVHKVTMLATGEPVSYKPTLVVKESIKKEVHSTMNMTSTPEQNVTKQSKSSKTQSPGTSVPEKVALEKLTAEVQEIRLTVSQLANKTLNEQGDNKGNTSTSQESKTELELNAEKELKETMEILKASPDARGNEKIYSFSEWKKKSNTTNDSRSENTAELSGIPLVNTPELGGNQPPATVETIEVDSIGGSGLSNISQSNTDNEVLIGVESFVGMSDFGDSTIDGIGRSGANFTKVPETNDGLDGIADSSSRPGDNDGNVDQMSQKGADEESTKLVNPEESTPLPLEDYNEKVEEILSQVEEELRETEAILMAKPGADPLGWDYDEEKLAPMTETAVTEDGEQQTEQESLDDDFSNRESLALDADAHGVDEQSLNGEEQDVVVAENDQEINVLDPQEFASDGGEDDNGVSSL